jgi:Tol biopolymer transport system component
MKMHSVLCALCVLATLQACNTADSGKAVATALSPDGARHLAPRYSPDGTRIAYWAVATEVAGWQLWVANADLSSPVKLPVTTLFQGIDPIWSHDGKQIAAISSQFSTADVVVVPSTGGAVKRLTQGAGLEAPLAWNPDGDRLAYYETSAGGTFRVTVVSVSTGKSSPLVPGENRALIGAWSPDGSKILYTVFDGPSSTIWVADSLGGNKRQLTTEGLESFTFSGIPLPQMSPDGKELFYESRRTGTIDIWAFSLDGGKPRQLTKDVRNDRSPSLSADGKWLAFVSDRGRQTDVWVMPAAGGAETRITDDAIEETSITWRAGTSQLAYVTTSVKSSVWARSLADGAERRLTPDSLRVDFFNVAPDGKQLDYVIARGGGIQDLAVVPIDGGASRTLVAGGGSVTNAYWSPDGSKIVFVSDRGGSPDPWVVDAAGGAPRQLVNWPGYESSPIWNADGSAIYFVSDRETRLGDLWKVPAAGGEPSRVTRDGSIGNIAKWPGGSDVFASTLTGKAGQVAWSRVLPDGRLQAIWDQTNALSLIAPPRGDSVAVVAEEGGGVQTMIVPTKGGKSRKILGLNDVAVMWSHDGTSVLYTITVNGADDLGIITIATGATRRLTTTPEDEAGAEWTPDDKTVVLRRAQTVARIVAADVAKLLGGKK